MAHALADVIPAHVRHLQLVAGGIAHGGVGEAPHVAGEQPQTRGIALVAVREQHLQAHADAQEGFVRGRPQDGRAQAVGFDLRHAVRRRALAGKDHAGGGGNQGGIVGDHHLGAGGHVLQGLAHRMQIAHAVVDDGDVRHYSEPFVEGMASPRRASASTAMRRARPKALNTVSA